MSEDHMLVFTSPTGLNLLLIFFLRWRPQFHFSEFEWKSTSEAAPPGSSGITFISQVLSVQIGVEAFGVPPGACVAYSTVATARSVIISVFCSKRHVIMIC